MGWVRLAAVLVLVAPAARAKEVHVRDGAALHRELARATAGTTIALAPGTYDGGLHAAGLAGTQDSPIVLRSVDPARPAVIAGGTTCLHLSSCRHVEIRDLVLERATGNGLNIDDGGTITEPAHHVTVRGVTVRAIGPGGNHDGIKLSGLDEFRVEDCVIEDWGRGGSGIDMVGCHAGEITGCTLRRTDGSGASGIQAKGGSRDVAIRRCRFEDAGARAVNLGGSTGAAYFRPRAPGHEAKDLVVEDCTFLGSEAAIAFVGVDGAIVRNNTIYRPRHWVLRILQESDGEEFVPCRNGRFERNVVVFRSDEIRDAANVGPGTAPETFVFAGNCWFCADAPARSRPRLPIEEKGATYGEDPRLRDAEGGDVRLLPGSPARGRGARAE